MNLKPNEGKGLLYMRQMFFLYLCVQILICTISCSKGNGQSKTENNKTHTQVVENKISHTPTLDSAIRKIDFKNMTYTAPPVYLEGKTHFKLKNGIYKEKSEFIVDYAVWSLVCVIYGDLTNDGKEEALTIIVGELGGTAQPFYFYIFSLIDKKPKIIWSGWAGSGGDGGLHDIKIENGMLEITLYGKDTIVNENIADKDEESAVCCPKYVTRSHYKWNGSNLERVKTDILSNPLVDTYHLFLCPDSNQ